MLGLADSEILAQPVAVNKAAGLNFAIDIRWGLVYRVELRRRGFDHRGPGAQHSLNRGGEKRCNAALRLVYS